MAHVEPLGFEELQEFEPLFNVVEQRMGFDELKQLIAFVARSRAWRESCRS